MDYTVDSALCACADGDMAALEWLYRQLYKYVCAVCYSVTGDYELSADSAQDAFARLPDASRRYRRGTNAKAYIFRVAYNCACENRRRFGGKTSQLPERGDGGRVEARMLSDSYVSELLAKLDKKQRTPLVMYVYGEMTYAEIASALGIHKNTVAKRINAAKSILKEEILKEGKL